MNSWAKQKQSGFTIVELLIVIVVIAILAAITIVAYNGIRDRAQTSAVQTGLAQANKKVLSYAAQNSDTYPTALSDVGVSNSDTMYYQYTSSDSPRAYAITASNGPGGGVSYYVTSTQQSIAQGVAPGHNLAVWNEPNPDTAPVTLDSGVAIDTSVFRSAPASLRFSPLAAGKYARPFVVSGQVGQTVTVGVWIRTDSNWNGTNDNSKIRFGANNNDLGGSGSLINACGYQGPKASWTYVTCGFTLTTTNPVVKISVGNNGSIGNIWLDDMSISVQ